MTVKTLARRAARVQAALPPPEPVKQRTPIEDLFTEQEIIQWGKLCQSMPDDPSQTTPEQWYYWRLWMFLYDALENNDQARATGYRYRLGFTTERVIEMFLSLGANGESDDELHWYTPFGLVYSHVRRMLVEGVPPPPNPIWTPEEERMHYVDEAWEWCIHAGLVEPIYHKHLHYHVEYPDKGRIRDREQIRAMYANKGQ